MGALEPSEKLLKESCKGVVRDSKERDAVSVSLSEQMSGDRLWNVNEIDCSTSDDSTDPNEDEGRDMEEPEDMDRFCNAENVTECELPERIVCYKDNIVKDICVDQGVTSLGQLLFGQSEIAEAQKDRPNEHQCASTGPMQTEKSVPASVDSAQHLVTDDLQPELSVMPGSPTLVPAEEESNNVSNKTAQESKIDNLCSAMVDITKAEAESSQNGHVKDGMIPDCHLASNLVRQSPRESSFSVGEASFSAAGPSSGLITYSGPIAYSGSCSLRSDSSTTSTRSFAFPVLQTEWNSSPVRMKAADRPKHRGWRQGFLCCRF